MDKKDEYLVNKIKALGYKVLSMGYDGIENANKGIYLERNWMLPNENRLLKGTDFYYDQEDDLIHFTSYDSLFSILNSGYFRLYNLLNMDDKLELDYGREALSFNYKSDKDKEELYTFSMCSSSVILNESPKKKKHELWKIHGKDGKGVVIRVKIMNDISTWYDYHLTKCFYDLKNVNSVKELHTVTNNEFLDAKINCFLKVPIYEYENEIRLIFDKRHSITITDRYNKMLYPLIYKDPEKLDYVSYFQLPIYNFFKNDLNAYPSIRNAMAQRFEIPKIAITEVILGYRYNDSDLKDFKEKIGLIDPSINVKMSDLKKFY